MDRLLGELRRRNVFRVAAAYLVVGWLVMQIVAVIETAAGLPGWADGFALIILIAGFPVAIFIAWAFELTPDGLKPTQSVPEDESISGQTGRRLDYAIIGGLALVGLLLVINLLRGDGTDAPGPQIAEPAAPNSSATGAGAGAPPASAAESAILPDERSIAVLPFVAMSNEAEDRFFADGLTEEILNSLAALPDLLVTSRTSAFQFRGDDLPGIPVIADQLGVAHVMEGSVRRAGDQVRITVQLIRARDDAHLWSGTYDRAFEDVFGIQEDVAENVADLMGIVLDDLMRERLRASGTTDVQAFIAFQRGREIFARHHFTDPPRMIEAEPFFEEATRRDPTLSQAYLLQADYYAHTMVDLLAEPGPFEQAEFDTARAEVDRLNSAALAAETEPDRRALVRGDQLLFSEDWSDAAAVIDQVFDVPDCVEANWASNLAFAAGRMDDFIERDLQGLRCDPLDNATRTLLAEIMIMAGRAEEAADHVEYLEARDYAPATLRPELHMALGRPVSDADLERLMATGWDRARIFQVALASYSNDRAEAERLAADILSDPETSLRTQLVVRALIGDRDGANAVAAQIDARPLPALSFLFVLLECKCGAPFDLEAAPNYRAQLEQAGFPWPPQGDLGFALKDW